MSRRQWPAVLGLTICLAIASAARAQQGSPHVAYVFPAGARQETTLELTVGGQALEGVDQAIVSGSGVQAKVVEYVKPISQEEVNHLRERMQELKKKGWDASTIREATEIRKKMESYFKRRTNPGLAETVTVRVTTAAGAEPGPRELRLVTSRGLTNPLVFCVGQVGEVTKEPYHALSDLPDGNAKAAKFFQQREAAKPATPRNITLPAVVNGQIPPGGIDRYRFPARQGQRLVVAVSARELIPYLPDAVPGWFQAAVTLYDAKGKELAFADHYQFHPDPILFYEIPADGQYVVAIRDSIYRGRDDFVYRIALGELPLITSIFPLGGKAGEATPVEVAGWNLPGTRLTQDGRGKEPGVWPISLRRDGLVSNSVPFALDTLPECLEKEPNDEPKTAQWLTLPVIVNGRIDRPGDRDVFCFAGRAGQQIVAEVFARRLDSPLDSILKLTDATGKKLAENDDFEDKGMGLQTHYADSRIAIALPADGNYYLHLGDVQHKGGPDYAYRLRLSGPQPDFALRVVPSSLTIHGGASAMLTVYALRKDGFSDAIDLALKDAPPGFSLSGGRLPAHQDRVRITLAAPSDNTLAQVRLEGRATIDAHEVRRQVVPAEDMMQAFAYHHLVCESELRVAVVGRGMRRAAVTIVSPTPVKIPAGGTARVQVGGPLAAYLDRVDLKLNEPPEGITLRSHERGGSDAELVFESNAAKSHAGLQGNLIVDVFGVRPPSPNKKKAQGNQRFLVGSLPAIPFEIVDR
jgi:hypothetical protein